MNILITGPSLNIKKNVSGISSVVGTIIRNNIKANYVHFIAGREDGEQSILSRIVELAKGYARLIGIFTNKKIELVHLNLPMNPKALVRDYLVCIISKLFRIKIIVHLHGGKYLLNKPNSRALQYIIRDIFSKSQTILCLSSFEKEVIQKEYNLNNVGVLENSVDDLYLSIDKSPKPSNSFTILFLGRLAECKGIAVIIESINQLMKNGFHNIHYIFCGTGPLEQEVKHVAELYPENVEFMGIVSGIIKTNILSKSQIFILPSLYGEGLPMSLIEAMACGLVPIVTNDGSMKTFITNEENGIVVEKKSSQQICVAILALINDPERLCKLSLKARQYITEKGSMNKYVSSLNEVYENSFL